MGKFKHGQTKTRIYKIWSNMRARCQNPENDNYKFYGGRGIRVCDGWGVFTNFYEDMKDGYSDKLTLDRKNNNGNYEKENCRWITHKSQCQNRRSCVYLEYNGKKLSYEEWGNPIGVNSEGIRRRLKRGWTIEQAVTLPAGTYLSVL